MRSWNLNPPLHVILNNRYHIVLYHYLKKKPQTISSNNLMMESIALPQELIWDGKSEPSSPSSSALFSTFEPSHSWLLFGNNYADEFSINTNQLFEIKPGFDILHELVDYDEKIFELSSFKEGPSPPAGNGKPQRVKSAMKSFLKTSAVWSRLMLKSQTNSEHWIDTKCISPRQHIDNTLNGIIPITSRIHKDQSRIGNTNFDVLTLHSSSLSQLTPPQSPVNNTTSVQQASLSHLIEAQDVRDQTKIVSQPHVSMSRTYYSEPFVHSEWNANNPVQGVSAFFEEIERETQIVDEIVNTRAKELIDWNDDSESMSSISPPSMQSMFDEEFMPYSSSTASSSATCSPLHIDKGDCLQSKSTPTIPKRRTRIYGRGVQDRKIRKKEQNKNAATRYRQKKRQEMECVLREEQQLTNQNDELKKIFADRKREAKYLKTLIREFYKKKI